MIMALYRFAQSWFFLIITTTRLAVHKVKPWQIVFYVHMYLHFCYQRKKCPFIFIITYSHALHSAKYHPEPTYQTQKSPQVWWHHWPPSPGPSLIPRSSRHLSLIIGANFGLWGGFYTNSTAPITLCQDAGEMCNPWGSKNYVCTG